MTSRDDAPRADRDLSEERERTDRPRPPNGTIAGRATSIPSHKAEQNPSGSPGAEADESQAREQER